MGQKKYNEFTVTVQNGKIIEKMPTARKSVMIYEHDAERNNTNTKQTKLYYELAETQPMKAKEVEKLDEVELDTKLEEGKLEKNAGMDELGALRAKAKSLNIRNSHAMGEKKLIEKIKEAEEAKSKEGN